MTFTSAVFSLFTTGRGVPAVEKMPCHVVTLNWGMPDSAAVGTSGSNRERFS
jgi:hypothetical protein